MAVGENNKNLKEFVCNAKNCLILPLQNRGVAQLASVLAWGASGRQFESDHSDFEKVLKSTFFLSFCNFSNKKNRIHIRFLNYQRSLCGCGYLRPSFSRTLLASLLW